MNQEQPLAEEVSQATPEDISDDETDFTSAQHVFIARTFGFVARSALDVSPRPTVAEVLSSSAFLEEIVCILNNTEDFPPVSYNKIANWSQAYVPLIHLRETLEDRMRCVTQEEKDAHAAAVAQRIADMKLEDYISAVTVGGQVVPDLDVFSVREHHVPTLRAIQKAKVKAWINCKLKSINERIQKLEAFGETAGDASNDGR